MIAPSPTPTRGTQVLTTAPDLGPDMKPHVQLARVLRSGYRGHWTCALLFVLIVVGFVSPSEARAAFGDCVDSGYVETFDPRLTADPLGCVERMRVPVETAQGMRHIRVVEGFSADWSFDEGYQDAVEIGVNAAVDALAKIGGFRMDDVTVLIVDDLPGLDAGEQELSHWPGEANAPVGGECRIAIYVPAQAGTDFTAFTIAHEIFHCVQYATAGHEPMASDARDWWVEGSAEWFADFAVRGTGELADLIATFDSVSIDTPVYDMAYEAVVLYLWLAQEQGPEAVIGSLRQMPDSASTSAQQAAMLRMMDDEDWFAFAKAYLDQDIVDAAGGSIDSRPVISRAVIEEPQTVGGTLVPFALERHALELPCGRWTLDIESGDVKMQAREKDTEEWGPPPEIINGENDDEYDQLLVAVNTGANEIEPTLEIGIEESCERCGETDRIDDCLVGRWRRTGGGAIEWMRRRLPAGMSMPRSDESGLAFVFRADGTYLTQRYNSEISYSHRTADGTVRGEGRTFSQTTGRWSVSNGRLITCPDAETVGGEVSLAMPEGATWSSPVPNAGAGRPQRMDYNCSDTSFETRMTFPGISDPLTATYSRIKTPDESEEESLTEIGD